MTAEKIYIEALSLPVIERAALAHKLLVSLESEAGSPEIEAAWNEETRQRCAAFDEGRITERAAADVLREAYRKVKRSGSLISASQKLN